MAVTNERSTKLIQLEFKDSAGTVYTPITRQWKLVNSCGDIVNNRDWTAFTGTNIVLSDLDLAVPFGDSGDRKIGIKGTYNASYGTDLPFTDEYEFNINDLITQP